MMVRLVKGAYWDTEIKRAQERGLDDYPVFTRKAMTDLNYMACARKLLAARPRIFPQFATHNALTVATILELAGGDGGFEFQRLHGMGEALYAELARGPARHRLPHLCAGRRPSRPARLSGAAAAGERRQLVVRRRWRPIETVPVETLLRRPADIIGTAASRAASEHPAAARSLSAAAARIRAASSSASGRRSDKLLADVAADRRTSSVACADNSGRGATVRRRRGCRGAASGFRALEPRRPAERARRCLERAADLLEQRSAHFIALLQREGGKTLDDALSEVREAVDFCRYYAAEGRTLFGAGKAMPGPTGESNVLRCAGAACSSASRRGIFRWRSFSARSRRRWWPATAWSPSPPSRRR